MTTTIDPGSTRPDPPAGSAGPSGTPGGAVGAGDAAVSAQDLAFGYEVSVVVVLSRRIQAKITAT